MNNRRHTTSFQNLTPSPISTPEDGRTQHDDELDRSSSKYYVPTTSSNRRFTRKNNTSHEKSSSNLLKHTPCRPEKVTDRSLAAVPSGQKIGNNFNSSYTMDVASPSTVSTVKGDNSA